MELKEWISYLKTANGRLMYPTGSIVNILDKEKSTDEVQVYPYFIVKRRGRGVKLTEWNTNNGV